MKKIIAGLSALTSLWLAAIISLSPAQAAAINNGIQPSPLHFGQVVAGTHPHKVVTVTNHTGRNQYIRAIGLSGAGGEKFTYSQVNAPGTCHVGLNLRDGDSCILTVRVAASLPEWYESHMLLNYGPRIHARPLRGNWNGAVYAHVVAT